MKCPFLTSPTIYLLFSECYLCCDLQLAKYLYLCYRTLQSQAAVEYRTCKCYLWFCVTILFHLGSSALCYPTENLCFKMGGTPAFISLVLTSFHHIPSSSLFTTPLTTELLCETGWAKCMGSYRLRCSFSACEELSIPIRNQNIGRTQVEMADRINTDSNTCSIP